MCPCSAAWPSTSACGYTPGDKSIGFGPTRKAISRIAKEGRKYGVFLGMVTQRPAELDATIISQRNTLFVMRMANARDQHIIRSADSDAAASLLAFLPSLGTREVFAFGEAVALPTRLRFSELPAHRIPRSESELSVRIDCNRRVDSAFIHSVVERWRGATMGNKRKLGESSEPGKPAGEWGAFVTEAEQPLLAAATRPLNTQASARKPAAEIIERGRRSSHCRRTAGKTRPSSGRARAPC